MQDIATKIKSQAPDKTHVSKKRVVIIEDEADIRTLIQHNLNRDGYDVRMCADGERGLQEILQNGCDLVILDLMLPGIQGLDVCRQIRAQDKLRKTGILILTARDEETDIVTGLELGADDYLVKPFNVRVLLARARALLRRLGEPERKKEDAPILLANLMIDIARHKVFVDKTPIDLTLAEFRILQNLAQQAGRVLTRNQLLDIALGQDRFVLNRTIDVHVSSLRRKLGTAGDLLETVRGVGYRLKEPN